MKITPVLETKKMVRLGALAFISGTVGFLTLLLLLLVPQMFQESKAPPPKINNLEVSCWTPDHFTDSMTKYSVKVCRKNLLNNRTYSQFPSEIPTVNDNPSYFNIFNDADVDDVEKPWRKERLTVLVVFQLLVVFGVYALIAIGRSGKGGICRVIQILGNVIGVVFFLLASFIPYISLQSNQTNMASPPEMKSGIVLCDLSVRILGNVQRFTLQCAYLLERMSANDEVDQGINAYLTLNAVICGAVAILALGSLITVLKSRGKEDEMIQMKEAL